MTVGLGTAGIARIRIEITLRIQPNERSAALRKHYSAVTATPMRTPIRLLVYGEHRQ